VSPREEQSYVALWRQTEACSPLDSERCAVLMRRGQAAQLRVSHAEVRAGGGGAFEYVVDR
jgi:hypothetical protein